MAWLYLFIAGILEVAWAIGMKQSDGFTKPLPTVWTLALMVVSFALLSQAVKTLPIGTSYAVWTGIGTLGTAILGILIFNEPKEFSRIFFILLIVIGTIGLRWSAKS